MDSRIIILTIFVLFGICNVSSIHPTSLVIRQRAEDALYQQLIKSRTSIMPRSSIDQCHDYYYKLLKETIELFENKLRTCENNKESALQQLASEGQQARDETTTVLDEVCSVIAKCKEEAENVKYFDCVNESGNKNSRDIWTAGRNSSENAAHIRQEIIVISFDSEKCVNETNTEYLIATDKVNQDLIKCFNNEQDVPNGTPEPEPETPAPEPETPEPETPAPEPETPEPETPAPETETPAPEPETPAPEPETPAPEPETPEPETPAPEPETPAPEPETPAPEPETEAPEPETPAPEPETPEPDTPEPDTPEPDTPAPESPSDEKDQVEELEKSNIRTGLENFLRKWGERF